MSTTPATTSYTDDQIQNAIDAAFPQAGASYLANLDTLPDTHCWPAEAPNRLAIARAFLSALPNADPYARLKAYNEAGARLRIDAGSWETKDQYPWKFDAPPHDYEVHPDDLHMVPEYAPKPAEASAEPEQAWANADNAKAFKEFQAEIEAVWEAKDSPWTPKPGDVVRLKSGGLPMTVESVTDFGIAFCSWMTMAGSLETRPVAVVMLTPAKEGQP